MIDRDFEERMDVDAKISAALHHAANVLWAGPRGPSCVLSAYATADDIVAYFGGFGTALPLRVNLIKPLAPYETDRELRARCVARFGPDRSARARNIWGARRHGCRRKHRLLRVGRGQGGQPRFERGRPRHR